MAARVLITRQERPGERELAAGMGLELVYAPLVRVTLDAGRLTSAPRATHYALTSRNAVEALRAANLLHHLESAEIWCVGPATAAALGGIPHHVSPGTTGEDLARFMLEAGVRGDVSHICGEPRRPELKRRLEEGGCRVMEWVVYRTEPKNATLPQEEVVAAVLVSPEGVKQYRSLGWDRKLKVPVITIGKTTADEYGPGAVIAARASIHACLEAVMGVVRKEG